MSISRKAAKQDIRTLHIKELSPTIAAPQATTINQVIPYIHHPAKELRQIIFISLSLFALLFIASYFDHTKHWVVPFAERLMKLGG